jgi:hypothetical protein
MSRGSCLAVVLGAADHPIDILPPFAGEKVPPRRGRMKGHAVN